MLGGGLSARIGWAVHARCRAQRRLLATAFAGDLLDAVFTPLDVITLQRGWVTRPSSQVLGRRYFLTLGCVMFWDGDGPVERLCVHGDAQRFSLMEELAGVVLAIDANERSFLRRANLEPPPTPVFLSRHVRYEWSLWQLLQARIDACLGSSDRHIDTLLRAYDTYVGGPFCDERMEAC